MSDQRKQFRRGHRVAVDEGGGGGSEVGLGRHVQHARRLQQLAAAVAGDRDQRAAFEAAPDAFTAQFGLDPQVLRPADPSGKWSSHGGLVIGPSAIEGEGLHSAETIVAGSKLCDVELDGKQSMPIAKMNRADTPNAKIVMSGGKLEAVSVGTVAPGEEIVLDYPHDHELPPEVVARKGDNYPTS